MNTPARKRFLIAAPLGIAFGFLCAYLASRSVTEAFWWTPLMWTIVTDRFVLGVAVGMVGVFVRHPIFGFGMSPAFRGAIIGILMSLPLATGGMINPGPMGAWTVFFYTLIAGAVYGSIIDVVATKFAGQ